jgi:hypothetical protein
MTDANFSTLLSALTTAAANVSSSTIWLMDRSCAAISCALVMISCGDSVADGEMSHNFSMSFMTDTLSKGQYCLFNASIASIHEVAWSIKWKSLNGTHWVNHC